MPSTRWLPTILLALAVPPPLAVACDAHTKSVYLEAKDFAIAVEATAAYAAKYGAEETLFVADIDNTLLAMQGELGSDQWFEWQSYLQRHQPNSPDLVAPDLPGLLDVQGLLFLLGKMRPPQEDLPELFRKVQASSVPTLVLTSRGPEFRLATERELKARGYDVAASVLATKGMPVGVHKPYDPAAPERAGLTEEEVRIFGLGAPRDAVFADGVYMTSGQHKGAMLLTVLHRAVTQPKAVVFVDDHGRHIHRVYDALVRRGIECTVIHYRREDANVARFRYGDKSDVSRRWRRLKSALEEIGTLSGSAPAETAALPAQAVATP